MRRDWGHLGIPCYAQYVKLVMRYECSECEAANWLFEAPSGEPCTTCGGTGFIEAEVLLDDLFGLYGCERPLRHF